jgi:hypothetical protein
MPVTSAFTFPMIFAPINCAIHDTGTGFSKRIRVIFGKGNYQPFAFLIAKGGEFPRLGLLKSFFGENYFLQVLLMSATILSIGFCGCRFFYYLRKKKFMNHHTRCNIDE